MALRWKKDKAPTGLAAIGAGPRGSKLSDGDTVYASVRPHVTEHRVTGWFWVARSNDGIPYVNTCDDPPVSEEQAKSAAMAHIKKHLAARAQSSGNTATRESAGKALVAEHDAQSLMSGYEPKMPVPDGGTERYNEGWKYGDWFLSKGGSPDADSPDGWHDEKYSGYWDRLAAAKKALEAAADACNALTGKARQVLLSSLSQPAGTKLGIDWYETRASNFDQKSREYIREAAEAAGFVAYRGGHPWVTELGSAWAAKAAAPKSGRSKAP